MNHVLVLTKNNLHLTQKCVNSIRNQTVHTLIHVYDNESTDNTKKWLSEQADVYNHSAGIDLGISVAWNLVLNHLFSTIGADHVFVLNNDTVIPPWFMETLLSYDGPFITGVSVGSMDEITSPPPRKELAPCPDMSAFLMRRECWERVGPFDEDLVLYVQDLDLHLRAHRRGIRLMNAGVPFLHLRSSTLNLAPPDLQRSIQLQADADREVFRRKWGVSVGGPDYAALFDEVNFGIETWQEKMSGYNHL